MPRSKPVYPRYLNRWEQLCAKLEKKASRTPAYMPTWKGRSLLRSCHRFLDSVGPTLNQLHRVTDIIAKYRHWSGSWSHDG